MKQVNMHRAKTTLSKLVEEAAAGEEIIIARSGKPVARLVALHGSPPPARKLGTLKGKIELGDDFDSPLPDEVMKYFRGEGED